MSLGDGVTIKVGIGNIQGMGSVQFNYGYFNDKMEVALPLAIVDGLTPTLELARDTYCPIQTGALRESAYLEAKLGGQGVEAEIGFARGGTPDYAVIVHENPAAYHKPPTQAKFLERAVNETAGNIVDGIFGSLKNRMGL